MITGIGQLNNPYKPAFKGGFAVRGTAEEMKIVEAMIRDRNLRRSLSANVTFVEQNFLNTLLCSLPVPSWLNKARMVRRDVILDFITGKDIQSAVMAKNELDRKVDSLPLEEWQKFVSIKGAPSLLRSLFDDYSKLLPSWDATKIFDAKEVIRLIKAGKFDTINGVKCSRKVFHSRVDINGNPITTKN